MTSDYYLFLFLDMILLFLKLYFKPVLMLPVISYLPYIKF